MANPMNPSPPFLVPPFLSFSAFSADLCDETVFENAGSSIDIINRAAVDPDGSQQPSVLTGASQVAADFSIGEEYGRSAISTFDATVEIVPLVHPTNRSIRLLHFVDGGKTFCARDLAEQREHSV